MRKFIVVVLSFAAAIVVLMAPHGMASRTLPSPTGPFPVGRKSFAWIDDTRADRLSATPSKRAIFSWVWYPAAPDASSVAADYLPASWRKEYRPESTEQSPELMHGHAYDEPPLSTARSQYPVLIFSPGGGQLPTHYTALMEELASYGYVVMAVAHPFETPVVVFPDGRVARAGQTSLDLSNTDRVKLKADDLVSTVSHIFNERERSTFFAHLDLQRVGAFGHSFGGGAAADACRRDPRIKAGLDLDGTVYGDAVTGGVPQPFLMMLATVPFSPNHPPYDADHDKGTLHEDMLMEHSPIAYRLEVSRLSHMNFTDKGFCPHAVDRLLERTGVRLDADATVRLASNYARAFFGQYLLGVPGPELDSGPHPHARMSVHFSK